MENSCSLHVLPTLSRRGSDSLWDALVTPKISVTHVGTAALQSPKTIGNGSSQHGTNQSGIIGCHHIYFKRISPLESNFTGGDVVSNWPQIPSGFKFRNVRTIIKTNGRAHGTLRRDANGL